MGRVLEPEVMDDRGEAIVYDRLCRERFAASDRAFARRAVALGPKRGLILDVGAGPAWIVIYMAQANPEWDIRAVELSDPMLELAEKNIAQAGLKDRITVRRGDAKSLPYSDRSFDMVISNSLLHHLEDPLQGLEQIHRVLRPRGALLVRDLRRPPKLIRWILSTVATRGMDPVGKKMYKNSLAAALTRRELAGLLARSPLEEVRLSTAFPAYLVLERFHREAD